MKVYLSKEQYKELLKNGSITVGETTILFNEEDDYITPIEEIDTSKFVTTNTQQTITAVKNISCASGATITLGFNGSIDITDPSGSTCLYSTMIQQIGSSGYMNFSYDYGLQYFNMLEGTNSTLKFPANKNGTIATTDDCKKYYRHRLVLSQSNGNIVISFHIITSRATKYGSINNLKDNIPAYTACVIEDTLKNPTHYSGTIYSTIDAGDNSIAIMLISTYSASGITTTGFNNIILDDVIDL